MRRSFLVFVLLCVNFMLYAQTTSLSVDCQIPGDLSRLIKYVDQQVVETLKVTGYLNAADFDFIGTLNSDRKLQGKLDLGDVYIVGSYVNGTNYNDDYLSDQMFRAKYLYKKGKSIGSLILPRYNKPSNSNSSRAYYRCVDFFTSVDSVYFEPIIVNYIKWDMLGGNYKNLILGENVDSIPDDAFFTSGCNVNNVMKSIHLGKNTRYIGKNAFWANTNLCDVNWDVFKDKLKYMGTGAFCGTNWKPDTIRLSNSLDTWNTTFFSYNDSVHIFIGENVKKIECGYILGGGYSTGGYTPSNLHFLSKTPPELLYIGPNKLGGKMIYVPYGYGSIYEKWGTYKYTFEGKELYYKPIVIESDPIRIERISLEDGDVVLNKVGDTYQLTPILYPSNADIKDLIYVSSDNRVCVVGDDGLIIATGYGSCTLIVRAADNGRISSACRVIVQDEALGVNSINMDDDIDVNEIYGLDGVRRNKLTKGVNIIKREGNKTEKVIIK